MPLRRPGVNSPAAFVFAGVLLLTGLFLCLRACTRPHHAGLLKQHNSLHQEVGRRMGEQLLAQDSPPQRVLLIQHHYGDAISIEMAGYQEKGLRRALKRSSSRVVGVEFNQSEPSGVMVIFKIDPALLQAYLEQHTPVDAIVSFSGLPDVPDPLAWTGPPIFVFGEADADRLNQWMGAGVVAGACVSRSDVSPDSTSPVPETAAERFAESFILLQP